MPVNGQNTGRDVSFQMVTNGRLFRIEPSMVTSFHPKPMTITLSSKGLDGKKRFGAVPDGYEGTISFDRASSVVDDWWAEVERAYYAGQDTGSGTIIETIQNPSGSISQFRYTDVVLVLDDLGERKPDEYIKGSIKLMASKREKVQ